MALIERGIVRTPVVDKAYADRLGFAPTANGWNLGASDHGSAFHLSIAGGDATREELIRSTKLGIWVTRFNYVNGLLEPKTALMTGTTRDGTFLIRDGEVVARLPNLRWTQSMVEAFSQHRVLTRERRRVATWYNMFGGTIAPIDEDRGLELHGQARSCATAEPRHRTSHTAQADTTMTQYIIRRFLQMIPITFGILTLVFSLIHLIPGDPARQIAGEGARPEDVVGVRKALGLDQPLWTQYVHYLGTLAHGDLGRPSGRTSWSPSEITRALSGHDAARVRRDVRRAAGRLPARHHLGDLSKLLDRQRGAILRADRRLDAELLVRTAADHRLRHQSRHGSPCPGAKRD